MKIRVIYKISAVMVTALLVSSCATNYQSKAFTGGYSETQLSQSVYKIDFAGNGFTYNERTSDFALLRAAELTLEKGYTHFEILGDEDKNRMESAGNGWWFNKPSAELMIAMYKVTSSSNPMLFDAAFVKKSLSKKYGITDY